jgi:hypothetical protein
LLLVLHQVEEKPVKVKKERRLAGWEPQYGIREDKKNYLQLATYVNYFS